MKKCPNCGAQIANDSLFCTECGKSIPQGNVCSHCGAQVNDGDAFCPNCGSKTDKQPISVSPAPEQKHCPHCGALVSNDSLFCENCGKNMSNGASAPTNISFQSQEPYKAEGSSQNKLILSIVIGLLVLALAGGGWWYYNSFKPKMSGQVIASAKNDSIADVEEVLMDDADSMEEIVEDYIDVDSIASDDIIANNVVDDSQYSDVEIRSDKNKDKIEYEEKQSRQVEDPNKVFDVVEQTPSFPGGDAALMRFLGLLDILSDENALKSFY